MLESTGILELNKILIRKKIHIFFWSSFFPRPNSNSFSFLSIQPRNMGSQPKKLCCQSCKCFRTASAPRCSNHSSDFVKTRRRRFWRSPQLSTAWLFANSFRMLSFNGSVLASAKHSTMALGFFNSAVTMSTIIWFTPSSPGASLARTPGKSMSRFGVSQAFVSMVIMSFSFTGIVFLFFWTHQSNNCCKADWPPAQFQAFRLHTGSVLFEWD